MQILYNKGRGKRSQHRRFWHERGDDSQLGGMAKGTYEDSTASEGRKKVMTINRHLLGVEVARCLAGRYYTYQCA
jgi:hypothetical protein